MNKLVSESTSTARSSAVVSATQLIASLLGGVFALLVAVILGQGDSTDGFLAAYSAYLLLILFGSTMRASLVPLLGPATNSEKFVDTARKRVSEILPIAIVLSLAFVVAAPLIGRLLLHGGSDDAKFAASESVAILGIAAIGQIWSAVIASVLAGARRFVASSWFYVASSTVMLLLAAGLMELWGVVGASIGVAIAAWLLALAHIAYSANLGFTAWPDPVALFQSGSWRTLMQVTAGSVIALVAQLNLTIAIGFVSGATGIVSGYVYAYLATIMATGVTSATIGLVTLPGLVSALDHHGDDAADHYISETAAFGTFLFLPVALGFACFGRPIVDAVLGGSLTASTLDFFWDAARVFLVMGLVWAAFVPLTTLALARRRFATLAAASLLVLPIHFMLVAILSPSGAIWTAVAHAISGVLLYVSVAALLLGRKAPSVTSHVARSIAPCALLALTFVIPRLALGAPSSVAVAIGGIAICSALYLVLGIRLWPRVGGRMFSLLLARPTQGAPVQPA